MKDFEGKIIKMIFNNMQGWITCNGYYIKNEGPFIVFKDYNTNRIRYVNERYIESIEIVGDIDERD